MKTSKWILEGKSKLTGEWTQATPELSFEMAQQLVTKWRRDARYKRSVPYSKMRYREVTYIQTELWK